MRVYLIGALSNRERIQAVAERLRLEGHDVFDDWLSPGPEADEQWQAYEKARGRTYTEALWGYHAGTVFAFDVHHLMEAEAVVMILPCGKSGHLEFGWSVGQGKHSIILFDDEPERYDIMYRFADDVVFDVENVVDFLELRS